MRKMSSGSGSASSSPLVVVPVPPGPEGHDGEDVSKDEVGVAKGVGRGEEGFGELAGVLGRFVSDQSGEGVQYSDVLARRAAADVGGDDAAIDAARLTVVFAALHGHPRHYYTPPQLDDSSCSAPVRAIDPRAERTGEAPGIDATRSARVTSLGLLHERIDKPIPGAVHSPAIKKEREHDVGNLVWGQYGHPRRRAGPVECKAFRRFATSCRPVAIDHLWMSAEAVVRTPSLRKCDPIVSANPGESANAGLDQKNSNKPNFNPAIRLDRIGTTGRWTHRFMKLSVPNRS